MFDLKSAAGVSSLGNSSSTGEGFILNKLVCKGREPSLDKCRFNGWGKHNCSKNHSEDVGVQCDAPTNESWKQALPEIRLVDL